MARRRGTAPLRPQPGRARRRGPVVTARPPPSRPRAVRSAAAARPDLGARRLLSLEREGQRVLTLLAPGIELVRLEALLPGVLGLVLGAGEPVGAPQLVVRLDQVRPELEGFLEEGLGVLVHLALQVDEAEIEMGVERRLLVVVEPDRLREVLDRLAENAFLQTDISDVDAGERVGGLFHEDLLKRAERVVVVLVQHLRPAEQRLGLRLSRGELQRLVQGLDRPGVVPEGDEAPPLLVERRRTNVVGVDRGARAGELGRRQLADERVHLLEVGDDLALHGLALGNARHRLQATCDLLVLGSEGWERAIHHQAFAGSRTTASSASFSLDVSSRAVLSTMMVRPSFTTRPVMYSAARPFTIAGGEVISGAATCSTSVTASTITPSLPPSHSRITVRVSSRSGAGALSRLRRSTRGTAMP